jgi:hypothetical protein
VTPASSDSLNLSQNNVYRNIEQSLRSSLTFGDTAEVHQISVSSNMFSLGQINAFSTNTTTVSADQHELFLVSSISELEQKNTPTTPVTEHNVSKVLATHNLRIPKTYYLFEKGDMMAQEFQIKSDKTLNAGAKICEGQVFHYQRCLNGIDILNDSCDIVICNGKMQMFNLTRHRVSSEAIFKVRPLANTSQTGTRFEKRLAGILRNGEIKPVWIVKVAEMKFFYDGLSGQRIDPNAFK